MIPLVGAHDFPYLFIKEVVSLFRMPLTWATQSHDSLGVFILSTLWNWPYGIIFGLAGKIGLNFTFSTWLFGILPVFIIGWLAMGKLLKSYSLSAPAIFVGQLLFVANTYILMLVDGGQLSLAAGYSLFPLVILYLSSRLNFILSVVAISFLDIRYLYVLTIPIGLKILFDYRQIIKYLITGLFAGLILFGLHNYWILPSIFTKGPSLPTTYTRPTQVEALSFANLSHSLLMIHPHWPKNIFGQINNPSPYFIFLPILAFLPLVIFRKSSTIGYWSILAIISIFLVKGSNPPFQEIYSWLFTHLPGFSLFRDPTKFFSLIVMSYSALIAFSADYIFSRHKFLYFLIPLYVILLLIPIFIGKATGLFSIARNQDSYLKLAEFLDKDTSMGSLLWVPSKPPLGYSSPLHPSMDALTLINKRPFATGVVGNYDLLNFLREATYSGELLDIASIKYLAISSIDSKRDSLKAEDIEYHDIFTKQLISQPWVSSQQKFGEITLLKTKNHQPLFFIPSDTIFVVGSDSIYNTGIKLKDNGLVFVESEPNLLSTIYQFSQAEVYLNNKSNLDVAAALVPSDRFVFPSRFLSFSPDSSGWWKRETADLIAWRNFLQQKYGLDNQDFDYGGGWAISEGKNKLQIPISKQSEVLLVRSMSSSRSGEISFYQKNHKIGTINTLSKQTKVGWHEVGLLVDSSPVDIITDGEINVLNALVTISESLLGELKLKAVQLQAITPTVSNKTPKIVYQKISPAHYTIEVSGLDGPTTLAFVQNHDYFWELSDRKPVPLYSLINGFPIPGNGKYDLYFLPQKYVNIGLSISVVSLIVLLLFIYNGQRK